MRYVPIRNLQRDAVRPDRRVNERQRRGNADQSDRRRGGIVCALLGGLTLGEDALGMLAQTLAALRQRQPS